MKRVSRREITNKEAKAMVCLWITAPASEAAWLCSCLSEQSYLNLKRTPCCSSVFPLKNSTLTVHSRFLCLLLFHPLRAPSLWSSSKCCGGRKGEFSSAASRHPTCVFCCCMCLSEPFDKSAWEKDESEHRMYPFHGPVCSTNQVFSALWFF